MCIQIGAWAAFDLAFQLMQVDNMFAPNHYESYCSALDRNVNCIGLLLVRWLP